MIKDLCSPCQALVISPVCFLNVSMTCLWLDKQKKKRSVLEPNSQPIWFNVFSDHAVPFHPCQISWVNPIRFAAVVHVMQSEVTEQRRPRGYIPANITLQWKLPASYSAPLCWTGLRSRATDCVLICSTCSLWQLLGRTARPINQSYRARVPACIERGGFLGWCTSQPLDCLLVELWSRLSPVKCAMFR